MTDQELIKQWDDYVESMGSVMGEVEHMAQQMADRIEELEAYIENAGQAMSETSPNWEARCHAIMTALNMDFGGYSEDLPEVGSWFEVTNSKNLARIEELEKQCSAYARADQLFVEEIKELEAKLTKAVEALRWAYDTLKEINTSNYTHDDACELNAASVEVILGIHNLLAKLNMND